MIWRRVGTAILIYLALCGVAVNLVGGFILYAVLPHGLFATSEQPIGLAKTLRAQLDQAAWKVAEMVQVHGQAVQVDIATDAFSYTPDISPPEVRHGYGRILEVGPGKSYALPSKAAFAARPGDIIEIEPGVYHGDSVLWNTDDIIIRGRGGIARLDLTGKPLLQNKAIWVVQGKNVRIENIEFTGAYSSDNNGAGIRAEGKGLHILRCYFHDNQEGILSGEIDNGEIVIEHSEFARNGTQLGQAHQIYIGRIARFEARFNYVHSTLVGSAVKSRARVSRIEYNRIIDGRHGSSNYSIDLSDGGRAYVIGNAIEQGVHTGNFTLITYAPEGMPWPDNALYVVHNTLVSDRESATFIKNHSVVPINAYNNLFVGHGSVLAGPGVLIGNVAMAGASFSGRQANTLDGGLGSRGNRSVATLGIASRTGLDYRLVRGAAAVDAAVELPEAGEDNLEPQFEYVHPRAHRPRIGNGVAADVGALELEP